MTNRKRLLLKAALGSVIVAQAGLAGTALAADTGPIKIGLILPMTGQSASTGRQIDAAVKLWMAQNGNKIAGRKVEVILKDDGAVPDATKRIAQELIVNDKVAVLAGFGITPTALATAPIATQSKTPMVVMAAATSSITEASPYIVRTSFTLPQVTVAHRRLGGQEQDQEGGHAGRRLRPRLRRREVLRQPVPLERRPDARQAAHAAARPRLRAGAAEGARRQARCAVRVPALGPGRGLHEAVRRARPRQEPASA